MVTFLTALGVLILGYFIYGRFIDRMFCADPKRVTPATSKNDGIDYVPMPTWKIFMIQFLNIAGLGPIFGAIMGAKFGISSYLWIVFGTIFAGAVHDYLSGMISLREGGANLPMIIGKYLGPKVEKVMTVFIMILMLLVGAVFISQPADLLGRLTPDFFNVYFWIAIIFIYYFIASIFPIDKIIGNIYPVFAVALLFMAFGILIVLFVRWPALPEIWDGLDKTYETNPIFPMMFISIACGAISGFHATQSPIMARCIKTEKLGRPIFYGAMVAEGIVALVWAAAATWYFGENGIGNTAAGVVMDISKDWLGYAGGILAVLGVIAAPITSGDTALRSARLILADFFHIEQKSVKKRLLLCIPIMAVVTCILVFSIVNENGFNIIWRYFAWLNQLLSVFTLWAITVYLVQNKKNYFVTMIPALFMTCVTITYICIAPEGLRLNPTLSYIIGGVITISTMILFAMKFKKIKSGLLN